MKLIPSQHAQHAPRAARHTPLLQVQSAALLCALAVAPCFTAPIPQTLTIRNFFKVGTDSLRFDRPLAFAEYPGEDSVYLVTEQGGRLVTVSLNAQRLWRKTDTAHIPLQRIGNGSNRQPTDVFDGIHTGLYESRGLLGFAFHPDYRNNRKYYVSYVTVLRGTEHSVLAERIAGVTLRPKTGDAQRNLLEINQDPYWDHKGGHIGFGHDGMLYFTLGDGGNVNHDLLNRSQNRMEWFGKTLRLNVNALDPGKAYAVPGDNPFVDSAGHLPEIWALGLRNPWKWTFHPVTGKMWLGDVGNSRQEEITIVPRGGNLGWKIWEGTYCYFETAVCNGQAFVPPVKTMQRSHAHSITGGAFFFGDTASAYHGTYIFGDYIDSHVWAMRVNGETLTDSTRVGSVPRVASFDSDRRGRIFATSLGTGSITANTGRVLILESPDMMPGPQPVRVTQGEAHGITSGHTGVPPQRLTLNALLQNRSRYVVTGLDGKVISGGIPAGTFLVRERARSGSARRIFVMVVAD